MKRTDFTFIKAYVVPFLVFIIIVLMVPLFIMPQIESFKNKNNEVKNAQKRLDAINTKLEALNKIDEEKERDMLYDAEKSVPTGKEIPSLIVGMKALSGKSGLLQESMNIKPGKMASESATRAASKNKTVAKPESKDRINFNITLVGSFENIKNFLFDSEQAKRLLEVVTFKGSQQADASYKFDLQIATPFKEMKSKGDIVSQSLPSLSDINKKTLGFIKKLLDYVTSVIPTVPTGVEDPFK